MAALAVRAEASARLLEEEEEASAELLEQEAGSWARVVGASEGEHMEPAEETRVVVTMHVAPEAVEPDAVLAMIRQEFCPTSVLGETTGKKQRTSLWAKVQETSRWSQYRPISGRTSACASFPSSCSCSWCPSSSISCRN